MTMRPVTRWVVQCDGNPTTGPCTELFRWADPYGGELALFAQPHAEVEEYYALLAAGWLVLRDGRHTCPAHVAAQESMVRAQLSALPSPGDNPGSGRGPEESTRPE
ncbi:hypothetical protein JOF53_006522 [Crossiella equi]|uniref:Uncharacterized protein n=1 Tax=Crossiella equi TaxID=130796 RepID=A0ABS5AM70_9PSEU|nr:hypothetical protein [Crossiella equi]MBP2477650.1 hypothetical protein [Crossiella equi]